MPSQIIAIVVFLRCRSHASGVIQRILQLDEECDMHRRSLLFRVVVDGTIPLDARCQPER